MNETQPPTTRTPESRTPDAQEPETQSIAKQKSLADRILAYSVIGSVLVNLGWLAWVSNSDLFGSAANLSDLKPQLIKIVKPPIPQKPKPKKKEKPPPPPPKQKPPPKVKPLKQIKPPPPRPQPRPQPRRPEPTPVKQVAVAHTNNVNAPKTFEAPPPAPNTEIGKPVESGPAPVAPPTPQPPAPPPPKTEPPAPPPPAPVKHEAPPPPPPPVHHDPPKPRIPDRDEPEVIGNLGDISLPQFDPGSLSVTSVTVTWEVDERGHAKSIKFRPTGNSDVDEAIRNAIQGFRYKPAVHNGVAETATLTHTFSLGS